MKHRGQGLSENFSYKIVALLITLILWVIILGSKDAVVIKKVRIEYLLPKNMMVVNSVPRDLSFKVSGPRIALKKFSEQNDPLTIDLSSALSGLTTVKIHPDSINVPLGIRVLSLTPSTITPKLEEVSTKRLPVEVVTAGRPAPGYEVSSINVKPGVLDVAGSRSVLESIKSLKTEPVSLSGLSSSVTREVILDIEKPGLAPPAESTVQVTINVRSATVRH